MELWLKPCRQPCALVDGPFRVKFRRHIGTADDMVGDARLRQKSAAPSVPFRTTDRAGFSSCASPENIRTSGRPSATLPPAEGPT